MNNIVDKSGSMSQALAREICSGVYRANSKLPGERRLSEYFKVSRTTARAVLEDFEKAGIIFKKPRKGAYVTDKAIEIIEQRGNKILLNTFFIMPPSQQINPLVRTIFLTFLQYINPKVQTSVLFQNEITEKNTYLRADDIAVVFGIEDRKQLGILAEQVSKLIILNKRDDEYNYLSPNNYLGGKMMAEYLIESGHSQIGCTIFKNDNLNSDFSRRYQGLTETLEKYGATLETFILPFTEKTKSKKYSEALDYLLKKCHGITALACMSDKVAMNIYAKINSYGINLGDDLSIISFDDQYYAQYTCPPLCSVKYPAEALGIHLANAVNNYLEDNSTNINEVIKPVLIKRQSVKKLK